MKNFRLVSDGSISFLVKIKKALNCTLKDIHHTHILTRITLSRKTSSGKSDEILIKWRIFFPDELFSPTINFHRREIFSINKFSLNKWYNRKKYGHIPREILRYIYFFIKQEGDRVHGKLKSLKCKPSPIPSGGLEVPLLLFFRFRRRFSRKWWRWERN